MMRTATDIDALLIAPKSLFGTPEWVESGAVATLTATILDDGGTVIGGLSLRSSVPVHLPAPQRGSVVLVLDRQPLQRLSFRPDHVHVNPSRPPIVRALQRQRLLPDRSRIYRWRDDPLWPRPDKLAVASPLLPEPADLTAAFALFLEECGISGYLPTPPHRPKLEL